jgi:DNA gyrase subunit A
LIAIKNVTDEDDLMIITRMGLTIRLAVSQFRIMGRATQGVRLINLRENDAIAAVAKVPKSTEADEGSQETVEPEDNTNGNNE